MIVLTFIFAIVKVYMNVKKKEEIGNVVFFQLQFGA